MFKGKKIILAVTGSIACYKSCDLARDLQRFGANVHVVMSKNATRFVQPLTFEALLGNKVHTKLFEEDFNHIEFVRDADLFVVAPATANIIGKFASGIADDLISTLFTCVKCPVLLVPAMHTEMWENAIVQDNLEKLQKFSVNFLGPIVGDLASGDYGKGRFIENSKIIDGLESLLTKKDLLGKKVLITVGATYEAIDPVRYISNHSSGKLGTELVRALHMRGAEVSLVSSLEKEEFIDGIDFVKAQSAKEMLDAVMNKIEDVDIFISNAAVADFRPKKSSNKKLKKGNLKNIELQLNEDILAKVSAKYPKKCMIGFSLGSDLDEKMALDKQKTKNLDFCIAVTAEALGSDRINGRIYSKNGQKIDFDERKSDFSQRLLNILLDA